MRSLSIALASILFSVAAQFCLKAGMQSSAVQSALRTGEFSRVVLAVGGEVKILLGFLLYAMGAAVWLAVLAKMDVSKAYPLVGFGFVLTLLVGAMRGESVSASRLAGVLFVCCGVWLLARS
jgi:multidrug transporter EmrE-like cation transporter